MILCKEEIYNTTQSFYVEPENHLENLVKQVTECLKNYNIQLRFQSFTIPFQYHRDVCNQAVENIRKKKTGSSFRFHSINIYPRYPNTIISTVH